jgi:hypothetical protein
MYGLCLNIYPNKSAPDFLGQCAIHGIHMASMASSSPKRNPYLVNSMDWSSGWWEKPTRNIHGDCMVQNMVQNPIDYHT